MMHCNPRRAFRSLCSAAIFALSLSTAAQSTSNLDRYYVFLQPSWVLPTDGFTYDPNAIHTSTPPLLRTDTLSKVDIGSMMRLRYAQTTQTVSLAIYSYWRGGGAVPVPCRAWDTSLVIPMGAQGGQQVVDNATWFFPTSSLCSQSNGTSPPTTATLQATDVATFSSVVRRTADDGSQYDASAMVMTRNGVPWMTYYWGYRLGLVASISNWDDANLVKAPELATWPALPRKVDEFELTALPPPWVEDDAVEYVNRADFLNQPGGQFFYAVLASDKTLLDSIANWQRTGKSFKSGGYVSVCRFYGGKNGGPNTHFYSADDKECAALKAIPQLSYEGQTFAVNMPMPAKNAAQAVPGALRDCPTDSKPLYRIYNNASASSGRFVSNHRYLTERADVTAAVAQGWVDEGQVMCVPS